MALADSAREFWDRISPRERMLVLVAAVAAPLTLALWLGLSIHDGLDDMAARNDKTRHALDVLTDLRARGAPVQAPVDDVVATMGTEPLKLETYLSKAAQKAGFALKSTRPRPSSTRNGFVTTSVSLDLEPLGIDELKTFLQEVESGSKVVAVTHLEVTRSRSKPDKVSASMEVSTYSREPKKDEGGGSASGSGSGGASAVGGSGKGS